jgi:CHAT domain-containing protein
VASHGFFLSDQELGELGPRAGQAMHTGENPLLRAGIALSGANTRRSGVSDDGILTALEAAQLDLHGTELVVLSACKTGVGQVLNGEGVYGLRRALFIAGAQTQITSLWKVADRATATLMVDYYERLLQGQGRSAALREAQQRMLSTQRSHPYWWASFVPIGDWTPLTAKR